MSDDLELDGLDDGRPGDDAPHPVPGGTGPWFIRFSGRRSGPFDAERLRTLARRGALTRMHSLSTDGRSWVPATSVRAVFQADGSVVAAGTGTIGLEEEQTGWEGELPEGEPLELPLASVPRRAFGSALVRPAVICALVLATVMLAMPTSRDESLEVAWWWSEGALAVTVRGMCAAAVLSFWVIAFLAPEPARAASVAAVAAVLAAASGLSLVSWAPWAVLIGLLVPVSALLVALDAAGSASARSVGAGAVASASLLGLAGIGLAVWHCSAWSIAGAVLGAGGAAALGFAGFRAVRRPGPGADGVFWSCVGGATGCMAALFAAAFEGLSGPAPMQGAGAAVSACLVLAFSVVAWASVHEASESSHLLPSDAPPGSPAPEGTA